MNRHLTIKTTCFCVLELRNSPAITRIPRLESERFNHNLFDPDLFRGSLVANNTNTSTLTMKELSSKNTIVWHGQKINNDYPAASYGVSARSYSLNAASSGESHPKRLM